MKKIVGITLVGLICAAVGCGPAAGTSTKSDPAKAGDPAAAPAAPAAGDPAAPAAAPAAATP